MIRVIFSGLIWLLFTLQATGSILPPNNRQLEISFSQSNLTEADFNRIIDKASDFYAPKIDTFHRRPLFINKMWNDPTVNASASGLGFAFVLTFYGGLAKHPLITEDSFALVVCHEFGHHIGGFPFVFVDKGRASEGQSDYYATQACAKDLWRNELVTNASFRDSIEEFPKALCDSVWTSFADQNLCYRTMVAGLELSNFLLLDREDPIAYDTPDPTVAIRNLRTHPPTQCRLDTYIAGALCKVPFDNTIIPATSLGINSRDTPEAEEIAASVSCSRAKGDVEGVRPRCWFASKLLGL